jgi:hypothetical protein
MSLKPIPDTGEFYFRHDRQLRRLLQVGPGAGVGSHKEAVRQAGNPHGFAGAGGMDKIPVADIEPHMVDLLPAPGGEKDQIALAQSGFRDGAPLLELLV